jgi:hypothetical protein
MLSDSYDLIFLVSSVFKQVLSSYVIVTKHLQITQFAVISISGAFICSHFRSPVSGLLCVTISSTLLG